MTWTQRCHCEEPHDATIRRQPSSAGCLCLSLTARSPETAAWRIGAAAVNSGFRERRERQAPVLGTTSMVAICLPNGREKPRLPAGHFAVPHALVFRAIAKLYCRQPLP